ncbi:T9SS type A sorting domain-containing protein [Flavivirga rizhaonensis]|uniref:T9SS type A sorting domain-containing protein n=1 Tax=Flavivirga rizhaonensis TaxID=2559571 RepID=A0A4S1E1W7_9FLAO|nr:spondin domain-containing protein [Flavivirga rizhaonensis]TGV04550.1 T9SS type A sorting domain-containing protein [Flavivirga rizhaonensis]
MKNFTFLFVSFISITSFSQSTANYTVVFESIWESVADNPTEGQSTIDLPGSAHWSPLVVATHKTANTFLMMGAAASPGIESVAETGGTSTFESEVNNNADADKFIDGGGLSSAKGTITINSLDVNEDFSLVTLASMIAPSPDWFIAVNGINLRSGNNNINNGWKDTFSIDLFPYDAGTEDGSGYSLDNVDSNPIGVITSRSNTTPFNEKKIGTLTFTYNSSTLSTRTVNKIDAVKIFPNPTNGRITLSNIQDIELNSIKVYNVLGKLVKQIEIAKGLSKLSTNLGNLNKGIYLLNLEAIDGTNRSQKLVIN